MRATRLSRFGPHDINLHIVFLPSGRRLFEEDNPLGIALEASVNNRNSKLILRDNTYSTIQWEAFTHPELNNFILILRREEELYMEKVGSIVSSEFLCLIKLNL